MRTDVRMRCFLTRHSLFWGEKKTPFEHSCDSEAELGSPGLSRLSAGIKHKARFAKLPCAERCWWNEALSSPAAQRIPVGTRAPLPPSPGATEQLGTRHPCCPFPPAPRRLCWPFPERKDQQVRGSRATLATAPLPALGPLPGMCRFPTVAAPLSGLTDVVSQLGFATCSAKSSQHPCASLSRQLPPRLLLNSIFRAGATCSASAGSGVLLPSSAAKTPILFLFQSFSLTLGLYWVTASPHWSTWAVATPPSAGLPVSLRADWEELEFPLSCPRAVLELQSS